MKPRPCGGPHTAQAMLRSAGCASFLTALGQDLALTVKPTRKRVGEMAVVAG